MRSFQAYAGILTAFCLTQAAYSQDKEPEVGTLPAPSDTDKPSAELPSTESESSLPTNDAASSSTSSKLLGSLAIGPHVAVGIPHPLTAGLDIVYADAFGLSISAGRSGTELDETELEIRSWDVGLSWFPFGGSFFVGALYGKQGVVGKRTIDLDVDTAGVALKVPTTLRLELESNYLTPHIGWFARWDSGFTLGFDIGVQLPSSSASNLQTSFANVSAASEASVRNSEDYKKNKKDVEDAAELIGKKPIPYINLIKAGWLF